jgi:hypothetical protein
MVSPSSQLFNADGSLRSACCLGDIAGRALALVCSRSTQFVLIAWMLGTPRGYRWRSPWPNPQCLNFGLYWRLCSSEDDVLVEGRSGSAIQAPTRQCSTACAAEFVSRLLESQPASAGAVARLLGVRLSRTNMSMSSSCRSLPLSNHSCL